jgi:ferredoxin
LLIHNNLLSKVQIWKQHRNLDKEGKVYDVKNIEVDEKISPGKRLQRDINGHFQIVVEPSLCLAFSSCETLAPKVFAVERDKNLNPKAKVISEVGDDFDSLLAAAQTCPTKAITIIDRNTGEYIYP